MDHIAFATCLKGHRIRFGTCQFVIKNNGTKTICNGSEFTVLSSQEVQCKSCKGIHRAKKCPVCDAYVSLSEFKNLQLIFD
jgi:hypothetical protein